MSQIRRVSLAIAALTALAGAYALGRHHSPAQAGHTSGRRILYYVDPMNPSYKSDKPGIAPDCGMPLEPVYADDLQNSQVQPAHMNLAPGTVSIDGATQQLLGIRVAPVAKGDANRIIHAVGRVAPDDTLVYRINSGVDGLIRDTFGDSVGTEVKKSQKLATYYSPDFLSVASGFLAASQRVPGANGNDGARTMPFPGAVSKQGVSSLQGYGDRLRNLGMSDEQIQHLSETLQLPEDIDIVSPVDGFILARNITPGMHFEHNMEFYRVADLRHVWVVAEVSEQDASYLHPGAAAEILLNDNGRRLPARVTDSLPQSELGGGTVKVRIQVDNPKFVLRPDMICDVELPVRLPPGITVPLDALVDSGAHARVYVERAEGIFEPREVQAGWRSADRVQILSGVHPGERVVTAATFLVDSESRLKAPDVVATPTVPVTHKTLAAGHVSAPVMEKDPACGTLADPSKCKEKLQNRPAASASRTSASRQPGS